MEDMEVITGTWADTGMVDTVMADLVADLVVDLQVDSAVLMELMELMADLTEVASEALVELTSLEEMDVDEDLPWF